MYIEFNKNKTFLDLTNEIEWCKSVIDLRFSQYFSADDSEDKKLQIEMLPPPELDENSPYGQVVFDFEFGFYERLIIALALLPHLCPQALDSFLLNNRTLGRPYTEFGGWRSKSHSGFLPVRSLSRKVRAKAGLMMPSRETTVVVSTTKVTAVPDPFSRSFA